MNKTITIQTLTKENTEEAKLYWLGLEKQVANTPLVCTWDWVQTWIDHYGDIVEYWFCLGFSGETVIGITIVTKETKRWIPVPVNAYHLGTQGEPLKDWVHMVNNNVLTLDSYTDSFTQALTKILVKDFPWEEFLVEDANPSFATSFLKSSAEFPISLRQVTHTCHIVDLEALRKSNKTVLDYFSRDTRYQIRRSMKEFGELEIEYASNADEALTIFSELQTLHQQSLHKKGKRGSYSSERLIAFHTDLIKKIFHTGSIIMYRVKSKRLGTLGCFYLMNDNGIAFGYSCGMADFSNIEIATINKKRLKPGFVMHALCMQECLDRGILEYNFSTGSEGYKLELTSETRTLVTLKLQRSFKSKIREVMFESYLKAEEKKQFQMLLKPLYSAYLLLNS